MGGAQLWYGEHIESSLQSQAVSPWGAGCAELQFAKLIGKPQISGRCPTTSSQDFIRALTVRVVASMWGIEVISQGRTGQMKSREAECSSRDLNVDVGMVNLIGLGLSGVADGCLINTSSRETLDQKFGGRKSFSTARQC